MSEEKELFGQEPEENNNEVQNTDITDEAVEQEIDVADEDIAVDENEDTAAVVEEPGSSEPITTRVWKCATCGTENDSDVCRNCGKEFEEGDEVISVEIVNPTEAPAKKKGKTGLLVALIIVLVALIAGGYYAYKQFYNPYNHSKEYSDLAYGETLGDIAASYGIDLSEFLKNYSLPEDMKGDTYARVAENYISVKAVAEQNNMDVKTYVDEAFGIKDEVSEDITMGELRGGMSVSQLIGGEERLGEFKEYYGLGDEVTGETKFSEIRKAINLKDREEYEKAMAAQEAQKTEQEAEGEQAETPESTEAAAEQPASEAPAADAQTKAE